MGETNLAVGSQDGIELVSLLLLIIIFLFLSIVFPFFFGAIRYKGSGDFPEKRLGDPKLGTSCVRVI